jgi:hypothetical protein
MLQYPYIYSGEVHDSSLDSVIRSSTHCARQPDRLVVIVVDGAHGWFSQRIGIAKQPCGTRRANGIL